VSTDFQLEKHLLILRPNYSQKQGWQKFKKCEGARSNIRLFEGTGFTVSKSEGSCTPCPQAPPALKKMLSSKEINEETLF